MLPGIVSLTSEDPKDDPNKMTPFKQNVICLLNHSLKRFVAVVRLTIPKSAVFQCHLLIHAALMSFVGITISAKSDARPSHEGVQVAGIDHPPFGIVG